MSKLNETKFATWEDLYTFCAQNDTYTAPLYYRAPLDVYPVKVAITRAYKNGKLAVEPTSSAPTFKADAGHLERFSLRTWV